MAEAVLSFIKPLPSRIHAGRESFLFAAVLLLLSSHLGTDYQNWQWCVGVGMAFFVPSWQLYPKKFGLLTIAMAYFVFQSFYTCFEVLINDKNLLLLIMSGMVIFSILAATQLGRWFANAPLSVIGYLGLANCVYVLARQAYSMKLFDGRQSGFIDYVGINGSLIAVTWPFLMEEVKGGIEKVGLTAVFLGALWFTKATIPYGVFAVVACSYMLLKYRRIFRAIPFALGIVGMAFYQGFRTESGLDRLTAYKTFLGFWAKHFSIWLGAGAGSFRVVSNYIQMETGYQVVQRSATEIGMGWWPWLHSDWLQTLFEFGIVGLVLLSLVYFTSLIRLLKRGEIACFSMFLGIGFTALCDYPLKYFVFELLAAIAVCRAYSEDICPQ